VGSVNDDVKVGIVSAREETVPDRACSPPQAGRPRATASAPQSHIKALRRRLLKMTDIPSLLGSPASNGASPSAGWALHRILTRGPFWQQDDQASDGVTVTEREGLPASHSVSERAGMAFVILLPPCWRQIKARSGCSQHPAVPLRRFGELLPESC
jgi:hypothetical protein